MHFADIQDNLDPVRRVRGTVSSFLGQNQMTCATIIIINTNITAKCHDHDQHHHYHMCVIKYNLKKAF